MKRLSLGFDLDETLQNMIKRLLLYYNVAYKDNLKFEDIRQYDMTPYLVPECKHIFQEFCNDEFFLNLDVEKTAVETLSQLSEKHDIYFVTAGHPLTIGARDEWLKRTFPFYRSRMLIACTNKQLLNLDILVDDYECNLIGGKYASVLINKPWNESFDNKKYGIERINKISDVQRLVERLEWMLS